MGKFFGFIAFVLMMGCTASKDTQDQDSVQYVHKYGTHITFDEWFEYGQSGQIITYLDNGVQMTEAYESGILHGDRTFSYPNDSAAEKTEVYHKGKLQKIIYYHPSNLPVAQTEFLGRNGIRETKWSRFGFPHVIEVYRKGRLVEGEYYCSKGNLISQIKNQKGVRLDRDFNGTLLKKEIVEDGIVTLSIAFYEDLFPKSITTFDKREIHGIRKIFLLGGEPVSEEAYEYGTLHGISLNFQDGHLIHSISYRRGKKSGLEKLFSIDGELIKEISWKNGSKHGPSKSYSEGNETVEWFFEGEPATQILYEQKTVS
ncbi:MAG: hypothetical protein K940chlam8_00940 [Chlamydiae bacterium]|nr:hypothetical protein [Chlamydiota bacterium]